MLIRDWEPVDQMTPRLWAYSSQMRRLGLACSWCQETLISLSCQAETSRLGQLSPWQRNVSQSIAISPVGGLGPRLITEVVGLGCSSKCWSLFSVLSAPLAAENRPNVSVWGEQFCMVPVLQSRALKLGKGQKGRGVGMCLR